MSDKMINLRQLEMASQEARDLIAEVAGAAAADVEALSTILALQNAFDDLSLEISQLRSSKETKTIALTQIYAESADAKSSIIAAIRAMNGKMNDSELCLSDLADTIKTIPLPAQFRIYQMESKFDYVAKVAPVWRARGIATVDVYVTSTNPSNCFLTSEQQIEIDAWVNAWPFTKTDHAELIYPSDVIDTVKADYRILNPTRIPISINIQLSDADNTTENQDAIRAALNNFFTPFLLGEGIALEELKQVITNAVQGRTAKIISPVADIAGGNNIIPTLGSVTFS